MKRLGIAIYPEIVGINETKKYILDAHNNGFKRIFANLLEIENNEDGQKTLKNRKEVFTYAKELGFEVIVDVNPHVYKNLGLKDDEIDFFKKLGATGIRLDEDFKGVVESKISQNKSGFTIELNASGGMSTIKKTLKLGGNPKNIIACHNFYPMELTGLNKDRFIELSSSFHELGIKVAAFITLPREKENIGPWNVNDGMPTIEEHRNETLENQISDMVTYEFIDDIIISQQGNTKYLKIIADIFNRIIDFNRSKKIHLNIDEISPNILEQDVLFKNHGYAHKDRPDYNSFFIRSTMPRVRYKKEEFKENNSGNKLKFGDIVILNKNMGRYAGEVHIILKDIDDNNRRGRNLIANINKKDLFKLKLLRDKEFIFKK